MHAAISRAAGIGGTGRIPRRHRARDREEPAVAARIRDLRQIHRRRRRAIRLIAATGWKRPFADPIPLPGGGRQLVTDAAGYIMKLPKAEQNLGEWQAAIECLILVAEKNGPTMMARIGMMKALNRHVVREFNPDRKDSNWGKRKLKRDQ